METTLKYTYKDSGIDWIGQIPEHWEVKKLKHFGKIYAGLNGKKGDDFNKEYFPNAKEFVPFTTIANYSQIRDERFQYVKVSDDELQNQVFKNDLLFLMSSETMTDIAKSSVYLLDKPAFLNSFCKGFRLLSNDINSIYANYLLNSITYRKYYELCGRGFTRINIKQEYINDTPFTLPPLHEQKAIADFLDKKTSDIDKLIHLKNQQIDLLKEHRQGIIHTAVTKGLNNTNDLHSLPLKDSGIDYIGQIPAHWEISLVKYNLSIPITDGPHTTPQLLDEGIPFISAEAIKNGKIDFNKKRGYISQEDYLLFSQKYIPQKFDIYMVKSGATTGNIGIVETDDIFTIWSPLAVFRANPKKILYKFLYSILESQYFRKSVELSWSFGTQQNIGMGVLSNLPICVPPLAEQAQIVAYLEEQTALIDQAIAQKEAQIAELKAYKQSLINEVVTGKINIL